MLMIEKYVLLQKAAQKILYGTLVKTIHCFTHSHTALDCVSRHITVRKAMDRFQHL
jgi:hypothetical protein